MKPGSEGSKKPKLYEVDVPLVGSVTTIASWPKRSQNSSPGAIVITSMRGAAMSGAVAVAGGAAAAGVDSACPAPAESISASSADSIRRMHVDDEGMHAAAIGAADAEMEAVDGEFFAGFRQVADRSIDQAADGVVFVVGELRTELLVEIADRRERIDGELAVGLRG